MVQFEFLASRTREVFCSSGKSATESDWHNVAGSLTSLVKHLAFTVQNPGAEEVQFVLFTSTLRILEHSKSAAEIAGHHVAGSLTNLAKYPASTVQILGAEKALFRALKTKGNTPKYGLIFHSSFIGRAKQRNKGRISRYLANKCSIASRSAFGFSSSAVPLSLPLSTSVA